MCVVEYKTSLLSLFVLRHIMKLNVHEDEQL